MNNLEFIVVQDILENETVKVADVVLPAAAFSEKAGSFTNMEGMVQCFGKALSPPSEAKSDLEILGLIAEKMGSPHCNSTHEEIRTEISSTISFFREKDARKHPIWIGEKSLGEENVAEMLIDFSPVISSQIIPEDDRYPYIALLGSKRIHLGSGTRTEQSARINAYDSQGEIEISPQDAEQLKLSENEQIKVSSAMGEIVRNFKINSNIQSGFISVPAAYNANDARRLLNFQPLLDASSSGWDSCQVAINKVADKELEKTTKEAS